MSATAPAAMAGNASPFGPRATLALVLGGAALFIALLWMIGAGWTGGNTNDGGGHAAGRGLNGYAALAAFLQRRGFEVRQTQTVAALDDPGLLVLTPPAYTDAKELDRIVAARRYRGPTVVITPKWTAVPLPTGTPDAKRGWVQLFGTSVANWPGFLDDVSLQLEPMDGRRRVKRAKGQGTIAVGKARPAVWEAAGSRGVLPDAEQVLSGSGPRLAALVTGARDDRILAAYVADGGYYPQLAAIALFVPASDEDEVAQDEQEDRFPLVVVFEPDLFDNYGFARAENAQLAEHILRAANGGRAGGPITFDLTLNGHVRSANLLTLAFTPPFAAATICLLIAALAAGWRAWRRFGPPLRPDRAIAFGKRALVANAAGLIGRSGRLHLVAPPYAAAARERLVAALGLPRQLGPADADAAIDRALARRQPGAEAFSSLARRLGAARRPDAVLDAARQIHALERTLKR